MVKFSKERSSSQISKEFLLVRFFAAFFSLIAEWFSKSQSRLLSHSLVKKITIAIKTSMYEAVRAEHGILRLVDYGRLGFRNVKRF